ncbi:MAG: GntR family transcriptional regulator [Planctomycetales bacterium]|nr:GntR family transcriptional regulator [Planctomycetales bacterium]
MTLVMPPGCLINERQLCEQLGVSRTPLREAILQLSVENLVLVIPNSGTFVSRINLQDVFDGQLVRDALEMKVVRLAAAKMNTSAERKLDFNLHQQTKLAEDLDYDGFYELDEEFHSMICDIGASPGMWKIINSAKAQLDRVRRLAFPAPSHLSVVLKEHTAIATALKIRASDEAAAAMKVHLDRVFETIRRLIVEQSDYFSSVSNVDLDRYESFLREARRDE